MLAWRFAWRYEKGYLRGYGTYQCLTDSQTIASVPGSIR